MDFGLKSFVWIKEFILLVLSLFNP